MPLSLPAEPQNYHFAGFHLDVATRTLSASGRVVQIQPRPFDLLCYLIEHRDRVVPRLELMREVWGAQVGPEALSYAVHALRRSLGDNASDQRLLKTVRGRGLQFVGHVQCRLSPLTEERMRLRGSEPSFVGREDLVLKAEEALATAKENWGSLLFLHGEAGIGKTRAIEKIASMALRMGFEVLGGQCATSAGELAFAPWRQVLAATGNCTLEALASDLSGSLAELAWTTMPGKAQMLQDASCFSESTSARSEFFDLVTERIARVSEVHPVLLAIDDAQRIDPDSRSLLVHFASAMRSRPVLILVGYRDSYSPGVSRLRDELGETLGSDRIQHHELVGLDAECVQSLIETVSGTSPSARLSIALTERTNGNPLFVTTLINLLVANDRMRFLGCKDVATLSLPRQIQDVVSAQLRELPERTVELLEMAATAGNEFLIGDLENAANTQRDSVLHDLEPALKNRVLQKTGTPGSFVFVHELVRDVILSALDEKVRAAYHARIGRGIERQVAGREWLRASELAHHYVEAIPVAGPGGAAKYLEMAADRAFRLTGFEEAAECLITLARVQSGSASVVDRCRAHMKLGAVLNCLGRRAEARRAFFEVFALARHERLGNLFALAALLYSPDFLALETGVVDQEHVSILREAICIEGCGSSAKAQLAARLGVALHWSDEALAEARSLAHGSVALAEDCSDPYVRAYAETAARFADFSVDRPATLIDVDPLGSVQGASLSLLLRRVLRVTGYFVLGQIGAVRAEIEEFAGAASNFQEKRADWYQWLWRSTLALMEGRFEKAEEYQERFVELGDAAGDRNAFHSRVLQHFLCCVDRGGIEVFEDVLSEMVERFPRVIGWRAGRLHCKIELGKFDEADGLLCQLVHEGALDKPARNDWYGLAASLATAASRLQDKFVGLALYERLASSRDHFAVIGYGSFCYGSVGHLTGLCAIASGDNALAQAEFNHAVQMNKKVGAVPAAARVLVDLAKLELSQGHRREGERHAREAVLLCEKTGMGRLGLVAQGLT